jgi:hypothetical protein
VNNGVEISQINPAQAEVCSKRASNVDGLDAGRQPGFDRTILGALSCDASDDNTVEQVEDWQDFHAVTVRKDPKRCRATALQG